MNTDTLRSAGWCDWIAQWCQQVGFACQQIDGSTFELSDKNGLGRVRVVVAESDALAATSALRARGASGAVPLFLIVTSSTGAAEALRAGADDVLRWPFGADELRARLSRLGAGRSAPPLSFGPLSIDKARGEVLARGQRVRLRKAEYSLLVYLIEQHPRAVDPQEIRRVVFQSRGDGGVVRYHVCMLRKKLAAAGADVIRNIRGVGYCANCGCASCVPDEPVGPGGVAPAAGGCATALLCEDTAP